MPFIPHTSEEVQVMLAEIGVKGVADLFDEIPNALKHEKEDAIPSALTELELRQLMQRRASQDAGLACYAGAGAYEHHIPAAVWNLVPRGEFYTAYTPYQAEASQGTLQLLYEFQSMMTSLTAMQVSNASLYDGASGLAEAILMAVRSHKKSKSKLVLLPESVHPAYRQVAKTIVSQQNIQLKTIAFDAAKGITLPETLSQYQTDNIAALVIPQPNFFGALEEVDALTDWAHNQGALVVAVVNPLACALLKPPGEWGQTGADIVCGEGQPLGVPLASGGPYFGFITAKAELVRQMPGRIVGRTVDSKGREGFTLTLQAREQHIRRSKATSNICTNQGLLVTAATIYMSVMGGEGLARAASLSHLNTRYFSEQVTQHLTPSGLRVHFTSPFFHEIVLKLDVAKMGLTLEQFYQRVVKTGYLPGVMLGADYTTLADCLLVCVTETKTRKEIDTFIQVLKASLEGGN